MSTEIDLTTALERAGILVENSAKLNVPVHTGDLRRSITHRVEGDTVIVGTSLEYAPYVEYGTGLFSSMGTGRQTPWSYQSADGEWHTTIGQRPQPYLQPALEANRAEVTQIIGKAAGEQLIKVLFEDLKKDLK